MDHPLSPRVHAQHLQAFMYKHVRLVGKVTNLSGETATIDAGGAVTLLLHNDDHLKLGNAAEVIGKVEENLHVRVYRSLDMGENFDYTLANSVVDVWHRFNEIFYDKDNYNI